MKLAERGDAFAAFRQERVAEETRLTRGNA